MNNIDLSYICKVMGNMTGIPVRVYREDQQIIYYSLVDLPADPIGIYIGQILAINSHISYFTTRHFNYYGIVKSGDIRLVIGPTRQTENSTQELRELAFRTGVEPEDTEEFISAMKGIMRMPLESVLQMLCSINYILNDEKLELKDITIFDGEQSEMTSQLESARSEDELSQPVNNPQNAQNTYLLEQQILKMVRTGDTEGLKKWTSNAPAVNGGILASEQLRQAKNTLVVLATLVSRVAIQGGMEADEAFSLSDAFIQRSERFNNLQQITNLQYNMVLDFADRMGRIRQGEKPTQLTISVSNYVRRHISEKISVEDIAKELFMSRPYLSAKFSREAGMSLTDFILKQKTEEAKRLLRYSDKSAAAISSYLGFSSQSHFSRVFRKYSGKTPAEYRDKYQR